MYRSDLIAAQAQIEQLQAEISRRDTRITYLERRLDLLKRKTSLWQRIRSWFRGGDTLSSAEDKFHKHLDLYERATGIDMRKMVDDKMRELDEHVQKVLIEQGCAELPQVHCPEMNSMKPCAECTEKPCEGYFRCTCCGKIQPKAGAETNPSVGIVRCRACGGWTAVDHLGGQTHEAFMEMMRVAEDHYPERLPVIRREMTITNTYPERRDTPLPTNVPSRGRFRTG